MFAHEASYDCTFCGTHACYGECRTQGDKIVYGGDKRTMEMVPTVQAASESVNGLRDGQESERRPVRALSPLPEGVPFAAKTYTRYRLSRSYRPSDTPFDTSGAMEYY